MTTSPLYLDHFQLDRPPFDQEPDAAVFSPFAARKTIIQSLIADIEAGKSLIKLTGSEGTGKTLLCRILEQLIDVERYYLVSLEHPVGSYKNLLQTVCLSLGTVIGKTDGEEEASPDYGAIFKEHIRRIEQEDRRLLILVDEAENLFLATLERLVRLICESEDGRNLQLLLVGRLDLDENLEQLSAYCPSVDIAAGYTLEPLNMEETRQYIHFRLKKAGTPGDKHLALFTDDAIDMIYQVAMGNISLTNTLAEQGMKNACAEGMFEVTDEMIQSQQSLEENVSLAFFQGYDFLRDHKWWLLAGTLLVWILLMFLWPDDKQQHTEMIEDEQLEILTPAEEIVLPPEPDETENAAPPAQEGASAAPDSGAPRENVPAGPAPAEEILDIKPPPAEIREAEPEMPEPEMTKPEVTEPEMKKLVIEPDRRKIIIPPEPSPDQKEKPAGRDADALFEDRVRASSTWLAWAYRGGYTIQLMVLASEKAEENLKKILVDDNYYAVRDNLYILKKRSPYTIYLFYGNYKSMDEARSVRNRMPPFLKETQPYVLSIQDALDKIQE